MTGISIADVTQNPVLRRELDERAKSTRAVVAITLWLLLLSGLASLVYFAYTDGGNIDPVSNDSASIGKNLFEWTLFGMMGLVLFLVPAFTASAVAGERTRQTLIPVQMTALSPFAIVLGKALAAIAFTVLLVVVAAPILAVAFLIGGVTVGELIRGLFMIVLTAVMLGTVGIMLSAVFPKVQSAIVMTYGFVLAITIGTFILLAAWAIAEAVATDDFAREEPVPPKELVLANPFVALADFTSDDRGFEANPLSGLRSMLYELDRPRFFNGGFNDGGFNDVDVDRELATEATSVWRWYVVFSVLAIYSSLYVGTNRLRTPAESER